MEEYGLPLAVAATLGAVGPVVIERVKRWVTSPRLRTAIAIGLSVLTGLLTAWYFDVPFTPASAREFVFVTHGAAMIAWSTWRGLRKPARARRATREARTAPGGQEQ